jgi:predicted transcriptional regulator
MSKETALQNYTRAMGAVESNIELNKPVFDRQRTLTMAVIDAENALRDAVAEDGKGVSNGLYSVTVTPQTQTVYDETKILSRLGITREQAVTEGIITVNQRPPKITIGKEKS